MLINSKSHNSARTFYDFFLDSVEDFILRKDVPNENMDTSTVTIESSLKLLSDWVIPKL